MYRAVTLCVQAAKAGYRLGNRTILDVIDAEIALIQRHADCKQAWYDHASARLQLRQAAGVLDFNELARIDARLRAAQSWSLSVPLRAGMLDNARCQNRAAGSSV